MVTKLVTLTAEMDALEAMRKLLHHRLSGAPVVKGEGNHLGVFSEKTAMRFVLDLACEQLPPSQVGAFMDTAMERTIGEETDLLTIAGTFLNNEPPVARAKGHKTGGPDQPARCTGSGAESH